MLDFRVVIAACIAGVVILLGGIGLLASFRIAQEPARPASRIVERPRLESNASLPVVVETPATKRAPVAVAAPAPESQPIEAVAPAQAQPAPVEITGAIAPKPAPAIPAPATPAAVSPTPAIPAPAAAELPTRETVEQPHATAGLPPRTVTAKKTPRRPRPAAPAPTPAGPINPFSALFGGFTNQ
jgi:hypothetical protein